MKRAGVAASSSKGAGRDFQHLASLRNGVIQEETEDESMGEQALLSIDEGELKSCRFVQKALQLVMCKWFCAGGMSGFVQVLRVVVNP